jgi:DHA2 family multidrug resistance protein
MILVGRLVGRIDGRYMVMFGFAVLAIATYLLSDINLEISRASIVWPQMVSGFAMGFVFVPLSILATGTLTNEQMGNATGIFNLMRNLGGSFGIAGVTTMLARGAQVHQAMLVSHLTPYDAAFQQQLHALTAGVSSRLDPVTSTQTAYMLIYQQVVAQATLLSYVDAFRLLAFLCLVVFAAPLLFARVRAKRASAALH